MRNFLFLDEMLDSITMYRLVLYTLLFLAGFSILLGFLSLQSYSGGQLLLSLAIILVSCYGANTLLSDVTKAPVNVESAWITALLLFCIITPVTSVQSMVILCIAGVLSMLSKYILVYRKKHIFNPAAVSVFLIGLFTPVASWWICNSALQPIVLILGFLVVKKLRKFTFVFTFLLTSLVFIFAISFFTHTGGFSLSNQIFSSWPLVFFASFMLTEPLTTPPTKKLQLFYAVVVGILFGSQFQLGNLASSPELALVAGNIFSFIVSPKIKVLLRLHQKVQIAPAIYEYMFTSPSRFTFKPGQYMEWTLAHPHPDTRGNRRYFTLASSPTEDMVKIGVRHTEKSSSFKQKLFTLEEGDKVIASQIAGDFILPEDPAQKIVFIAGGIGVTPFRSMVKYLLDTHQARPLTLFYTAKTPDEFAYKELFDTAAQNLHIKTIYTITSDKVLFPDWVGKQGRITAELIKEELPDFMDHIFYLSGPITMVDAFTDILKTMGLPDSRIKKDFFPGFA